MTRWILGLAMAASRHTTHTDGGVVEATKNKDHDSRRQRQGEGQ